MRGWNISGSFLYSSGSFARHPYSIDCVIICSGPTPLSRVYLMAFTSAFHQQDVHILNSPCHVKIETKVIGNRLTISNFSLGSYLTRSWRRMSSLYLLFDVNSLECCGRGEVPRPVRRLIFHMHQMKRRGRGRGRERGRGGQEWPNNARRYRGRFFMR